MKIKIPIQVRFRDIDAMGHVNSAVYLSYFEQGRVAYGREVLGVTRANDFNFVIAEIRCRYRSPVKLEDEIFLSIGIDEVKRSSFRFCYRLEKSDGTLAAEGESVQVMYDYRSEKAMSIPAEVRQKISDWEEISFD